MNIRPPAFVRRLFPALIWEMPDPGREVYLTFDDGPSPEVTPWVLEQLEKYDAKGTFFCLGKNAEQYPELFARIIAAGHKVGNHTYSHRKGWEMGAGRYIEDVDFADGFIRSDLVRPPYGRITPLQARLLAERYRLIGWTILSRDYSRLVSPQQCVRNVIRHVRPGAIIVFHDSVKASRNLRYALPRVLKFLQEKGYRCEKIEL